MKTKLTKRALSILLSLLMVVTAIPMGGFIALAQTDWTLISSTDFTKVTWSDVTGSSNYRFQSGTGFKSVDGGTTNVSEWSGCEYKADDWTQFQCDDDYGVKIRNGFLRYAKNVEGGNDVSSTKATPVTGLSAFKVDVQFSFFADCNLKSIRNDKDAFCFIKFKTNDYNTETRMWENQWFTQAGYGSIYGYGSSDDVIARSPDATSNNYFHLGTSNSNISAGDTLHYIAEFSHGALHSYVTDASGNMLINYGAVYNSAASTSNIKGIFIGAATGSNGDYYYQNLAVNNVRFYSGDPDTSSSTKDNDQTKDKYLFTYFTGNNDEGERLRYAVSDDGYNYESLNGGWRVSKDIQSVLSANANAYPIYPSGTAQSANATGNIRDPYVLEAQDGTYYILATDLDTNTNGFDNNSKMLVWHLNDPVDIDTVDPWVIDITSMMDTYYDDDVTWVYRAWAPEAIWDPEMNAYMLVFAARTNLDSANSAYMYYVYTRDFQTFLTNPERLLPHVTQSNIDGNITYYNGLYYLWYKDETNSKIGYATAERPCGPYSQITEYTPSGYTGAFEGVEVFKLHNSDDSGKYVLIADNFSSGDSFIAAYSNSAPYGFSTELTPSTTFNLSHLNPRHASVCRITTEQYNNLIAKFGKNSWDTPALEDGDTAENHLVARYFTTDDATFDASGNKHHLDSANPVMETVDGRYAANFYNGKYAEIDTYTGGSSGHNQIGDINATDGVTFDWWGRGYCDLESVDDNNGRFFDWTSSSAKTLVWDDATNSQKNNSFIYCAQNLEFGTNTGYGSWCGRTVNTGFKQKELNTWHRYTMTVQNGWMCFYRDGVLLQYGYTSAGKYSPIGTPMQGDHINQALFDRLRTLRFSYSSWRDDHEMWGSISDFRIYNKAMKYSEVAAADTQITNNDGKQLNNSNILYYDPMEDMSAEDSYDGDVKHVYTASADDTGYGKVLNIAGGVTSHNGDVENASYVDATDTDDYYGYTISYWYKPGATNTQNAIFNIGRCSSGDSVARKEFEITENGGIVYYYDASYEDGTTYIDDNSANVFDGSLTAGTWAHIVMQIVPNGKYDLLKTYVNGTLKSTINVSSYSAHIANNKSLRHYIANHQHNVNYGKSLGTGWYGGRSANASSGACIDEFKIYSGIIKPSTIIHQDDAKRADLILHDAVTKYKEKMADLSNKDYVYTNMKAAYDAYDTVQRYDDSVKYGGYTLDVEEVITLANDLKDKTDAMVKNPKPNTVKGYAKDGKNTVSEIYTRNMITQPTGLYTPTESPMAYQGTSSNSDKVKIFVSSSNFVWLYTGEDNDEPVAPYNVGFYRGGTSWTERGGALYMSNSVPMTFGNLGIRSGQVDSRNIDSYWYVSDTDYSNTDSINWIYESSANRTVSMTSSTDDSWLTKELSGSRWNYGSGYAYFNGNEDTFLTSNTGVSHSQNYTKSGNTYSYLISFTPTYQAKFKKSGFLTSTTWFDDNYISEGTGTIYVINYKHVNEVLNSSANRAILTSITTKNAADAKAFLRAYDSLTGLNYMTALNNNTNNAEALAISIKSKVDTLESLTVSANIDHSAITAEVASDSVETEFYNAVKDNAGIVTEDGSGHVTSTDTTKKYTTSSLTAYKNAYEKIKSYFYSLNYNDEDQAYATDQTTIDRLLSNINSSHAHLVRAAEFADINAVAADATDETATRRTNNYNDTTQIYTYSSWMDYVPAYKQARDWYEKPAEYKADIPYYSVPFSKNANGPYIAYDLNNDLVTQSNGKTPSYYVYLGEFYESQSAAEPSRFETGTWVNTKTNSENPESVSRENVGDCRFSPGETSNSKSALQSQIESDADAAEDAYEDLVAVDDNSKFETFDSSVVIANGTVDRGNYDSDLGDYLYDGKYTRAAVATFDSAINTADGNVYHKLTDSDYAAYNAATGKTFSAGAKIKDTNSADTYTANVLTAASVLNSTDSNINRFYVNFHVQDEEGNTIGSAQNQNLKYGSTVTLTVPESALTTRKLTKWSISNYRGVYDTVRGENEKPVSSQKASTNNATTLTRNVNCNMEIVAEVTNDEASAGAIRYNIYNGYNTLSEVIEDNSAAVIEAGTSVTTPEITLNANGDKTKAKEIPLYEFDHWEIIKVSDYEYKLYPRYDAAPTYTITVTGATESVGTKSYDQKVTIEFDDSILEGVANAEFAAWAENSSGKLKLASYDEEYTFFVCTDESYVPIINYNGTLKVYGDDSTITAEEVDGAFSNTGDQSADEFVNWMIANEKPFITIQREAHSNNQVRVYCRVTAGASDLDGYGVLFRKDNATGTADNMVIGATGVQKRGVTNKLYSGQFTYTLNNKNGFSETGITNVPFRGFADYSFSYTYNGTTYNNFNGTAYSGIENVDLTA